MTRFTILAALTVLTACGGGSGSGGSGGEAPSNLTYSTAPAIYRADQAIPPNTPQWQGGTPTSFSVLPVLPLGLVLDAATGVITGTPTVKTPDEVYTVTASNASGSTQVGLHVEIEGALPPGIETLDAGYEATLVLGSLATPVKIAMAPDGRIFFNELSTGNTRIISSGGMLEPVPFATVTVATGNQKGLLGLVLDPDFNSNGYVYTMHCDQALAVSRVLRYTDVAGVGTNPTVIVDDIPLSELNNGGDLVFGLETPEPRLYVSVGDTENEMLAQTDGSLAGRVLRYTKAGLVPSDNPIMDDPEWCRGLRNTFALAIQPETGGLFGGENGPAANDELNFLNKGKNFEWGGLPPMFPPGDVGIQIRVWVDVIVPTALTWHDGTGWGAAFANDLFLCSYDDEAIRHFDMSGIQYLDIDDEQIICEMTPNNIDNKPLDIFQAPDGSLYFSTFTSIYRITRD